MKSKFFALILVAAALGACSKAPEQSNISEQKFAEIARKSMQDRLKLGQAAPNFITKAALNGEEQDFNLNEALKNGPVVLYFFPKAFTPYCNLEAHDFSEKADEFKKYGATLIGLSTDNIDTLKKFSKKECSGKFMVGHATSEIIKQYGVSVGGMPITTRTSFVISKFGDVKLIYTNSDYHGHADNALEMVKELKEMGL